MIYLNWDVLNTYNVKWDSKNAKLNISEDLSGFFLHKKYELIHRGPITPERKTKLLELKLTDEEQRQTYKKSIEALAAESNADQSDEIDVSVTDARGESAHKSLMVSVASEN